MLVALMLPGSIALATIASGERGADVSELALSPASFDAVCLGVVARALAASGEPVSVELMTEVCVGPVQIAGDQRVGSIAASVLVRLIDLPPPALV